MIYVKQREKKALYEIGVCIARRISEEVNLPVLKYSTHWDDTIAINLCPITPPISRFICQCISGRKDGDITIEVKFGVQHLDIFCDTKRYSNNSTNTKIKNAISQCRENINDFQEEYGKVTMQLLWCNRDIFSDVMFNYVEDIEEI